MINDFLCPFHNLYKTFLWRFLSLRSGTTSRKQAKLITASQAPDFSRKWLHQKAQMKGNSLILVLQRWQGSERLLPGDLGLTEVDRPWCTCNIYQVENDQITTWESWKLERERSCSPFNHQHTAAKPFFQEKLFVVKKHCVDINFAILQTISVLGFFCCKVRITSEQCWGDGIRLNQWPIRWPE